MRLRNSLIRQFETLVQSQRDVHRIGVVVSIVLLQVGRSIKGSQQRRNKVLGFCDLVEQRDDVELLVQSVSCLSKKDLVSSLVLGPHTVRGNAEPEELPATDLDRVVVLGRSPSSIRFGVAFLIGSRSWSCDFLDRALRRLIGDSDLRQFKRDVVGSDAFGSLRTSLSLNIHHGVLSLPRQISSALIEDIGA